MGTDRGPPPPEGGSGVWNERVDSLLEDWRNRVYAAQSAHYASADAFRALNYLVGVPSVIFSSAVGTALFTGLEKDSPKTLWVASISLLAAALAGLQTFLRFAERASNHARAADWYAAIRRDIEQTLHLPVGDRPPPKECLDEVRKEMNRAGQDAPELTGGRWRRQARRFGVREPDNPL